MGRAGWVRGGRREPIPGGLSAASMPRTPPRIQPARPPTVSVCFQTTEKKSKAGSKRRSLRSVWPGSDPFPQERAPTLLSIYVSTPTTALAFRPVIGNLSGWGGVGWRDRRRHGWRLRAYTDVLAARPATPHRPTSPQTSPSRYALAVAVAWLVESARRPQAGQHPPAALRRDLRPTDLG